MFAKECDEIFHKVIKGFEWGTEWNGSKNTELKSKSSFLNVDGKIEYLVATRKFLAVLHEPEDDVEAGPVRPKENSQDFGIQYNLYIKAEGQKEMPEGYGLFTEGALLIGRAAKLFQFDNKKWVEADYVKCGDGYAIRIKDTERKMTFITMLRNETAYVPEWAKQTDEEKAKMEAEEERRKQKDAEYAEINRTLEA